MIQASTRYRLQNKLLYRYSMNLVRMTTVWKKTEETIKKKQSEIKKTINKMKNTLEKKTP